MNRLKHYALSICLILSLMFYPGIEASASNVSLGVSASSINIGDSVTVSVTVPDNISATVDLSFSSDVLAFSSASADVGTNGGTITMNVGKYSLAASNTVSVTFTASTSGTASVSASVVSAVDNDTAEEVSLGGASTSITVANQTAEQPSTPPAEQPSDTPSDTPVEEPKSSDNSLSSLKLSAGTLSPGFAYNVTNYTATVGYNVTNVVVSAVPSNGNATIDSVTGNGNVNLEVGENTIQIIVKAENGLKATYTIVVTRLPEGDVQSDSSENESESQDVPETENILQWNGQTLHPVESIPDEVIPSDFSTNTIMINSVEVPCLTFANGNLKVLYLQNEEGTNGLYIYDEVQNVVYPFVKISAENNYVIVLLPDGADAPAPENYKSCTLSIEGKGVINAYQFVQSGTETETTGWLAAEIFYAAEPVSTDFYLIYCMNNAGETGWYVYDSVEGTAQRYLGSVHTPVEGTDGAASGTAEDADKLLAELEAAKKMQLIIICGAVFVVAVLVIIIVNLILRNRPDEMFEDEDYDDEDDEYYDEYEFPEDEDTTEEIEMEEVTGEEIVSSEDEMEIEFYEMPQADTATETNVDVDDDDELEIEFYEMTQEETKDDDEVEVEFYNMEDLLVKEAIAPEQEISKAEKTAEIPEKQEAASVKVENIYVDDGEDDDDLEFIELD